MSKAKIYEALLVISTFFLVIYLLGFLKNGTSNVVYIYIACGIGLTGIFIKPAGKLIAQAWHKFADLLSLVSSKILMTVIYIVILLPVATLYKLIKKDKLQLRRDKKSKWVSREHLFSADDLKNIW